jgi:hypothetical protein
MFFLTFFYISTASMNTLFPTLQPHLERPWEVVFGQSADDPLPLPLDLVQEDMGRLPAPSSSLGSGNSLPVPDQVEKGGWWRSWNFFVGPWTAQLAGKGELGCFPRKYPLFRHKIRPFLAKSIQKLLKGTNDVINIHSGAGEDMVGVSYPLAVKKSRIVSFLRLVATLALTVPAVPF